jgi:hypothetical protein
MNYINGFKKDYGNTFIQYLFGNNALDLYATIGHEEATKRIASLLVSKYLNEYFYIKC